MSDTETRKTIGADGLVEFGQYLTALDQDKYRDYTFEMPDGEGRRRECSLGDVLRCFRDFFDGKADAFTVGIGYVDYQHGMIGRSDRTFTRSKQ